MTPTIAQLERLSAKIVREENGCWETKPKILSHNGYALWQTYKGKAITWRVARLLLKLSSGNPLKGLVVDHLCRNRACVNPAHLEAVTQRENLLRGDTLTAKYSKLTHCKRGHEFTSTNTYRTNRGHRGCVTCRKTAYNYERIKFNGQTS